jgi:hypothetical protein
VNAPKALEALRMIYDDCDADTVRREGMGLTGRNVAEALGEICAQIQALSAILVDVITEQTAQADAVGR